MPSPRNTLRALIYVILGIALIFGVALPIVVHLLWGRDWAISIAIGFWVAASVTVFTAFLLN